MPSPSFHKPMCPLIWCHQASCMFEKGANLMCGGRELLLLVCGGLDLLLLMCGGLELLLLMTSSRLAPH